MWHQKGPFGPSLEAGRVPAWRDRSRAYPSSAPIAKRTHAMNVTAFPRHLALGAVLGALVLVAGACSSTSGAAHATFPPAGGTAAPALPTPAASAAIATPLPSVAPSLGV